MWLLKHEVIPGDTSADAVWDRLEQSLLVRWPQEGSPDIIRPLEGVAIDSGYLSQRVYDFCSKAFRMGRPWYAVKGQPGAGKIAWEVSKFRSKLLGGAKLHNIGVDALKTEIAARLSSDDPKENFIYVAKSDEFTLERIEQIFAEKVLLKINTRGFETREWVKIPGRRNELLDLMVYADAVHRSLAINHELRLASATERRVATGEQLAALFNQNAA
jgi:phage terminase large subunit GpA-like protein